jgi:hypothetical protein
VHDTSDAEAEHLPIAIRPNKAYNEADHVAPPPNSVGERQGTNVISRRVTVFHTIRHANGEILTGWEYENGHAGVPMRQYCYYMVPHSTDKYKSSKVDIAYDGSRLPDLDAASIPYLEEALSKCQWWKEQGTEAVPAKR